MLEISKITVEPSLKARSRRCFFQMLSRSTAVFLATFSIFLYGLFHFILGMFLTKCTRSLDTISLLVSVISWLEEKFTMNQVSQVILLVYKYTNSIATCENIYTCTSTESLLFSTMCQLNILGFLQLALNCFHEFHERKPKVFQLIFTGR